MADTFRKVYKELSAESANLIREIKSQAELLEALMIKIKSREMSLALTNLEQAMMWSTKAIVLHDEKQPQDDGA
jgi:hypothetical protein